MIVARSILSIVTTFVVATSFAQSSAHNYRPSEGYVPDAVTAIKIAVAVWEPIYGREQIAAEKPYKAILQDGVWIVEGSLPRGMAGGVAVAEISKYDGKILRVSHGK
jgi:hypothetical protein